MPIYEVEGPDGKWYEFDAPDPDALDAAVSEVFGNSPVTPQDEPGFLSKAGNFAKDVGNSTLAMVNEGLNAATFGLTGQAERLGGAAIGAATNDNPEMSYGDFVKQMDQSTAQRRSDYPIASVGGSVIGSIAPAIATGGAAIANQTASRMLGEGGARAVAGRVAASSAFGGAENAAIEAGRGNIGGMGDLMKSLGLGAAFGAAGQLVGEVVEPTAKFVAARLGNEKQIKRAALERVGHSLMDPTPGPGNAASALGLKNTDEAVDFMYDAASRTGGPNNVRFGETSDDMLRIYAGNVADTQTIGLQGSTKELAETRVDELSKGIRSTLKENLIDAGSPAGAQAAQNAEAMARGKALYQDIFDTPSGKAPVIKKKDLIAEIERATDLSGRRVFDPATASSAEKRTLRKLKTAIKKSGFVEPPKVPQGAVGPDGMPIKPRKAKPGADSMSMASLRKFKIDEVDRLAASLRNPSNASQGLSSRIVNSVRSLMDDVMEGLDPRYAEARSLYAIGPQAEEAAELGRTFIKGTNTSVPIAETLEQITAMPPAQKLVAQEEALDWIIGQIDQSDAFLKKLATDNPAMLQRIDGLFGTSLSSNATNAEDVLNTVAQMARQRQTYKGMLNSIDKNIAQGARPAGVDRAQDAVDIVGIGATTALGHPLGAANATRARRLMSQDVGADSRVLSQLMQAQNPTTSQRLLDEIMAARTAPSASAYGGLAGAGGAVGLQTIMDMGRNR